MTTLRLERYEDQKARWPDAGRHVLAQYDDETIVVYQAYRPEIGLHTALHQRFGGGPRSVACRGSSRTSSG